MSSQTREPGNQSRKLCPGATKILPPAPTPCLVPPKGVLQFRAEAGTQHFLAGMVSSS